jgi:uncharacterized protein (TIGR00255 family)
MPIESMTGFARTSASLSGVSIVWEVKSVNGKSLDIRLRLPPGWDRLEQVVRQKMQAAMQRGSLQANLTLDAGAAPAKLVINEALIDELVELASRVSARLALTPPSIAELLNVRGVVEPSEAVAAEALEPPILAALDIAIRDLKAARTSEGTSLQDILQAHLNEIERLALAAEADPSRQPDAIKARIAESITLLTDASPSLDESRLNAEALFIATRADIREELDRLKAHVKSARQLLTQGGAVGRKLDFLAQEFNREANTLCSKSNAASITAIGLELKSVVDQFREQVQNLE